MPRLLRQCVPSDRPSHLTLARRQHEPKHTLGGGEHALVGDLATLAIFVEVEETRERGLGVTSATAFDRDDDAPVEVSRGNRV